MIQFVDDVPMTPERAAQIRDAFMELAILYRQRDAYETSRDMLDRAQWWNAELARLQGKDSIA